MKTAFTIIPDPERKDGPTIIRQDNPGPDTPAIIVPPSLEEAKDGGVHGVADGHPEIPRPRSGARDLK